jgi:hypothetical protein
MTLTTHPQRISGQRQPPERRRQDPLGLFLPHLPSAPALADGPLAVAALQTDASRRRIPSCRSPCPLQAMTSRSHSSA